MHHLDELEEHIRSTGDGSKIDVGQYELHPWCDRREIVSWLQKRNIVVEAYSPMAHGTRMDEPLLRSLGKKYGKTPAQIMIRWAVQNVSALLYTSTRACVLIVLGLRSSSEIRNAPADQGKCRYL